MIYFNIEIVEYDFTEDPNGIITIKLKIKGKGFLTRPIKKMTLKLVYDEIKNYLLFNEIPEKDFKIHLS